MVIESLIFPLKAENKPWIVFFVGALYSLIGIFLALWIFGSQASYVMVFLTVMACIPLFYNTIKLEEQKDTKIFKESRLLREHNKAIIFLVFLFVGITTSYVVGYVILPEQMISSLFVRQTQTIAAINNQISGNAVQEFGILSKIILNNVKVLAFCLFFSFVYGSGAIFILTWNASVIGAAIGNFIRSNLAYYVNTIGLMKAGAYLQVTSLGVLRYALHGIPEIVAYFYGGLAGGIISVAIIRHHIGTKKFANILRDSSDLVLISLAFLVIAALIEVYVSPMLL